MEEIELGAHLISPRTGFTHHGIYVGDGKVVHYSGLSNGVTAGPVEVISIEFFSQARPLSLRRYKAPKYTGYEAVTRARSRIGETDYDIQCNNCEHFCSWVITGESKSEQVETTENILDCVLPPIIVVGLKARKHIKRKSDSFEVSKDLGENVALTATAVVLPITTPFIVLYKVGKWFLRSNT